MRDPKYSAETRARWLVLQTILGGVGFSALVMVLMRSASEYTPTWPDRIGVIVMGIGLLLTGILAGRIMAVLRAAAKSEAQATLLSTTSARREAALVDALPDQMFYLARSSECLACHINGQSAWLGNRTETEIRGYKLSRLLPTDVADVLVAKIARALDDGGVQMFETTVETAECGRLDYEIRIIATGKDEVLTVARDITERKRTENDLHVAKESAEAANIAKSQFLARISHDIRTPLGGVLGMAELLDETPLNAEQKDYLNAMRSSAESLLSLVNDLLDLSKIEAGKLDLEPFEFNVRDSVCDFLGLLALSAERKGLELACHIPADVPATVIGDVGRLRQVMVNLVGNATKFTDRGEIVVSVTTQQRSPDRVVLQFTVRDSGIGIPKSKLDSVFQPFVQLGASNHHKAGGAGLGLAISSQLVELMGGKIWVESEVGEGSAFHFTVPFARPKAHSTRIGRSRSQRLMGLRALVVDDSDTNRGIVMEMLRDWQADVVGAENAAAALDDVEAALLAQTPFDLFVVDAHMPGVDGFALVQRLQAERRIGHAIVVMMTAQGHRGDAARCRELGVSAYLPKPVRPSLLREALQAAYGRTSERHPSLVTQHSLREERQRLDVLVVEDNAVNRKLIVRMLERRGHAVETAINGDEAVNRFKQRRFDVVLMDLQMPVMDGMAATAAIRAYEAPLGSHTPIVAMTAHALKGDRERCLEAGMDDYISKPIRADALAELLHRLAPPPPFRPPAGLRVDVAGPADTLDSIDLPDLMERVENDFELARDLAGELMGAYPAQMAELKTAVDANDANAVKQIAHSLRGAVAVFSAPVAERANVLEQLGAAGDLTGAPAALAQLHEALVRLRPVLESLRTSLTDTDTRDDVPEALPAEESGDGVVDGAPPPAGGATPRTRHDATDGKEGQHDRAKHRSDASVSHSRGG